MPKPLPEWQRSDFAPRSLERTTSADLASARLERSRARAIATSTAGINVRKTKRAKMKPDLAAKALIGGHFDVVQVVITDLLPEDKPFWLLRLSEEYGRLLGDQEKANKVIRRLSK